MCVYVCVCVCVAGRVLSGRYLYIYLVVHDSGLQTYPPPFQLE